MTRHIALIASFGMTLMAGAAAAQTADPTQMAHLAASNQLGILEYCKSNGWTDQASVDAERKSIASLPAATDSSGLPAAEDLGKQGTFSMNGNQTTLSQMANGKNTSVSSICNQLGTSTKNAVASMAAAPGGMPGMPSGMKMPSMPGGMSMPSMPGAPSAPGTGQ